MIACVAVVGKQNQPLYIRTFVETKDDFGFRFHFHVHTSLDVINEKVTSKSYANSADLYLGHLFSVEGYKVYGYITNTKIKFIVIIKTNNGGETNMKNWIKGLHGIYVSAVMNPFSDMTTGGAGQLEDDTVFVNKVYQHVLTYNKAQSSSSRGNSY